MGKKKKKKDNTFYWESPEKFKPKEKVSTEPFEFKFTFPRIRFPEMKHTSINMEETDKHVIVKAELPGFKKDEINLNVTEANIEISATKRKEKIDKGEKYFRQERKAGAIKRAFSLPTTVDPSKSEARFENDLLTIVMPKSKANKKGKKINVE